MKILKVINLSLAVAFQAHGRGLYRPEVGGFFSWEKPVTWKTDPKAC